MENLINWLSWKMHIVEFRFLNESGQIGWVLFINGAAIAEVVK